MRPRPEDEKLLAAPGRLEAEIVLGRGARVGVVPARHVNHRHGGMALVEPRHPDADALPGIVEDTVRPLLEEIGLVIGRRGQRRVAAPPRHAGEPRGGVDRLQRRLGHRVGDHLGRFARLFDRPGRLLQLEGAALADAAEIGVGEAAGIEELTGKPGRVETAERPLRVRRVGQAHRADAA